MSRALNPRRRQPQGGGQATSTAKPMTLRHLTISGYRGISNTPGQELCLPELSFRNVFIGQNNGGKSTAYRFLLLAAHHLAAMGNSFPYQQALQPFDPNLFWQQNEEMEPWGILTFSSPGPDFARVEQPGV